MGKGGERPKIKPIKSKYVCFFCGKEYIWDTGIIYVPDCECGCGYAVYQLVEDIYTDGSIHKILNNKGVKNDYLKH